MAYVKVDENEPLEKSISREWSRRKASSASGRSVSTTRSPLPSRTARTRLCSASR